MKRLLSGTLLVLTACGTTPDSTPPHMLSGGYKGTLTSTSGSAVTIFVRADPADVFVQQGDYFIRQQAGTFNYTAANGAVEISYTETFFPNCRSSGMTSTLSGTYNPVSNHITGQFVASDGTLSQHGTFDLAPSTSLISPQVCT